MPPGFSKVRREAIELVAHFPGGGFQGTATRGVLGLKRIYVGNLSYTTDEQGLRAAFAEHGEVQNVALIMDRETGRPRGFAFVEMTNDAEADAAIEALNGATLDGRRLTVNEARPREERGGGPRRRF